MFIRLAGSLSASDQLLHSKHWGVRADGAIGWTTFRFTAVATGREVAFVKPVSENASVVLI